MLEFHSAPTAASMTSLASTFPFNIFRTVPPRITAIRCAIPRISANPTK